MKCWRWLRSAQKSFTADDVESTKKYGVELLVCSSLNRNSGTMVREKTKMEKMLISGVAADKNVAKIRVAGLATIRRVRSAS